METRPRKPYPSDVTDEEWAFVAPYLTLMTRDAPQRHHDLREVFNALRWIVRAGAPWRMLPTNFPPWEAVYQQTRRWLAAGVLRGDGPRPAGVLRWARGAGRQPDGGDPGQPHAAIARRRAGRRAGYDGHKRRKGSKVHVAVDTLGHLLALHVTPANAQDRARSAALAEAVQEATGQTVEVAFVDQGYTGEQPGGGRRGARHRAGGGQAAGGQARLRAAAPALGGGAHLRLGGALPPPGPRLRTLAGDGRRAAFRRLRLPDAPRLAHRRRAKSITGSRVMG